MTGKSTEASSLPLLVIGVLSLSHEPAAQERY